MHKYFKAFFVPVFICMLMLFIPADCQAENLTETDCSYIVLICDNVDLLSETEEQELAEIMKPISTYGHAIFVSIDSSMLDLDLVASLSYLGTFGDESGVLFLIDTSNQIYVYCNGEISEVVNETYAETIADNVFRDAQKGNYFQCAKKAYTQINTLLNGGRIPQPIKHISNALLAITLAFLLCYMLICTTTRRPATPDEDLLKNVKNRFKLQIMDIPQTISRTQNFSTYHSYANIDDIGASGGISDSSDGDSDTGHSD